MDTAERLLREASGRLHLSPIQTDKNCAFKIDAHLSSSESRESAAGHRWEHCFLAGCQNEHRCLAPDHCEAENIESAAGHWEWPVATVGKLMAG